MKQYVQPDNGEFFSCTLQAECIIKNTLFPFNYLTFLVKPFRLPILVLTTGPLPDLRNDPGFCLAILLSIILASFSV